MFPYTGKCTESESDIQNNDLLYRTHQKHQTTFDLLEMFGKKIRKTKNSKCLFYYIYKFHNPYFGFFGCFVNFVIFGIFVYFVYFIYCGHFFEL